MRTATVRSVDGTSIGYRQVGQGPGVVLLHGGMMASHNLAELAGVLSGDYTVYVPDRRGRGMSGPVTEDHAIEHETQDLDALLSATGACNVFGLSVGAAIALHAASHGAAIMKLALYEPPLTTDGYSTRWLPRYERELAAGAVASAFVTILKATADPGLVRRLPRWMLVPLMSLALAADSKKATPRQVPLRELIATMRYDAAVLRQVEKQLDTLQTPRCDVLLLGGQASAAYLQSALDNLADRLPTARRATLQGVGHLAADNGGRPELVAAKLRQFFA